MNIIVNGKNINYKIDGNNKEVILLVHGWGGCINSLGSLHDLFANEYKVISIDLPGFGDSSQPDKDWGIEEYADLIIKFAKTLNINRFLYFGHSFGGALGIYLAATYPEAIEKLILAAPSYRRARTSRSSILLRIGRRLPCVKALRPVIYKVLFPNSDLLKFPNLEQNFKKIVSQDLTGFLDNINVPTLILWGAKDAYVPIEDSNILHQRVRNSSLKVFGEYTHGFPLAHPEVVHKEVLEFLK